LSVRSGRNDLWKQVTQLLRGRPGWTVQATPSPGDDPVWCFGPKGQVGLAVRVDGDVIRLQGPETGQDIAFSSLDELVAWMRSHSPNALMDKPASALDRLKVGKLFEWR
jgi:hypothetical protein